MTADANVQIESTRDVVCEVDKIESGSWVFIVSDRHVGHFYDAHFFIGVLGI